MHKFRVLVLAFLANPTCTNWIYGFKSLGYRVVVLNWSKSPATQNQLAQWGFQNQDIPIFNIWDRFTDDVRQAVLKSLGGIPDVLFCWEGALILKPLRQVHQSFPRVKVVQCVNTFPNAVSALTELRMYWRYRNANSLINGYIFYSEAMRRLFLQKIPASHDRPYLIMVEPFFEKAFASHGIVDSNIPRLERFNENPHIIIFTGRGVKLWSKNSLNDRRDALGPFFKRLAERGVHIFLPPKADTKGLPNLHLYPEFSNADLFEGRFAQYISQFDAHLVIYNEWNGTIRRWVSSGLSTRLAYSLTSTSPLAVTHTSKFIEEYWKDTPFGFTFCDVEDLVKSLYNTQMLTLLRQNMEQVHRSYAFESQGEHVAQFFKEILAKPGVAN